MKKSDVPSTAELVSGMPLLESVKPMLSLFICLRREEAKDKQKPGGVRHKLGALPWSAGAKAVRGTP